MAKMVFRTPVVGGELKHSDVQRLQQGTPLVIPGLSGCWHVRGLEMSCEEVDVTSFGSVRSEMLRGIPEYELHLVYDERVPRSALRSEPKDVRRAIEAIYELDEAAREQGKQVVADVVDPHFNDGSRFRVSVVELR